MHSNCIQRFILVVFLMHTFLIQSPTNYSKARPKSTMCNFCFCSFGKHLPVCILSVQLNLCFNSSWLEEKRNRFFFTFWAECIFLLCKKTGLIYNCKKNIFRQLDLSMCELGMTNPGKNASIGYNLVFGFSPWLRLIICVQIINGNTLYSWRHMIHGNFEFYEV